MIRGMVRNPTFDVVVAGAGPSGSVLAARLAMSGFRILLVEASGFDGQRNGEYLAPEARALVNQIGILERGWERSHQLIPELVSTWGSSDLMSRNYIFNPHGHGLALDRCLFDRELAKAAEARGVLLLKQSYVRAACRSRNGWEIVVEHEGRSFNFQCRFIAGCCGRAGVPFPGLPRTRRRTNKLICLGLRVQNYKGDVCPTIEAYSKGWAYSVGLASGELIVNLFIDGNVLDRPCLAMLLHDLANCPLAASRVINSKVAKSSEITFFCTDASSICSRPSVGNGWCLVGDAAQSLDPLSSGGITQALRHAVFVSDLLVCSRSFSDVDWSGYRMHLDQSYSAYEKDRRQVYRIEQRWQTPFWSSGHQITAE